LGLGPAHEWLSEPLPVIDQPRFVFQALRMHAHRPEHWMPLSIDSIFLPSHFSAIKTEKKELMAEKCYGRKIRFKSTIRLLKLNLSFTGDNSQVDFRFNFQQLMRRRSSGEDLLDDSA
jgi:hypothetical protein